METIILTMLDIIGGILINIGVFISNLKLYKNPRIKIKANISMIFGCSALALLLWMSTSYIFSISVQLGVILSSILGIVNCSKEIKQEERDNKNKETIIKQIMEFTCSECDGDCSYRDNCRRHDMLDKLISLITEKYESIPLWILKSLVEAKRISG